VCRTVIFTVTAFVLVAALLGSAADQPDEKQPIGGLSFKDEIELTVVNVEVHVDDKDGNPVTDLTIDDFRVIQDGQERPLTHFQAYTGQAIAPVPAPELTQREIGDAQDQATTGAAEDDRRPVYVAFYVDNQNLDPLDRNRVLSQAAAFVQERLHPPVKMMVVSYSNSLTVVQSFTDDQELILRALRSQRMKTGARVERDQAHQRVTDTIRRGDRNSAGSRDQLRMIDLIEGIAEEESNSLRFSLHALRTAVASMAGLPGEKSIIYISNGLPMVPGMDLYYIFASTFDSPTALTQLHKWDQSHEFTTLAAAANAQDVTLYTIGAGGIRQATVGGVEQAGIVDTVSLSVSEDNYVDGLRFIAERTGGRALVFSNDFGRAFNNIGDDLFSYYSLGYPFNMTGGDKVHRIEVELPEHHELTLRYRQRFVEKSLETRVQEKVVTNLVFPIDENPLEIKVSVGAATAAGPERVTVPIQVDLPLRLIALLPEGESYVGRVLLYIAARDSEGGQSDIVRQEHEVRVAEDQYAELESGRWSVDAALLMKNGDFTVSVGLMDQITRQTSFASVKKSVASSD